MKIDAADILIIAGMVMTCFGTFHFNPWFALILTGLYLIVFGAAISRSGKPQKQEG